MIARLKNFTAAIQLINMILNKQSLLSRNVCFQKRKMGLSTMDAKEYLHKIESICNACCPNCGRCPLEQFNCGYPINGDYIDMAVAFVEQCVFPREETVKREDA